MRHLFVLLLLAPLAGCVSLSGRAGMVRGLGDVAEALNARQGTDFSGGMRTTGYGIGGEMYGILGFQGVRMTGTQTSTGTDGAAHTLHLTQADTELNLAYPVNQGTKGPILVMPGLSLTYRTSTLRYERAGDLVSSGDGTALILRPHVKAVTSLGDRLILSAGGGYEFAFLDDGIGAPGGVLLRPGLPGPQANVTATLFFCSGCVGG